MSEPGAPRTPELSIICSSVDGRERLVRIAAELLGRMRPELAARLARRVMVVGLDGTKHAAFAQSLSFGDVTGQLARERVAQGEAAKLSEPLVLIVINLDAHHRSPSLERTVAHELGHVACGHTDQAPTAERLTAEQLDEREREAEAFADRYVSVW